MVSNSADDRPLSESEARLAKIVSDVLQGKSTLRAEVGITDDEMEAIYAVTYNLYSTGKYMDAARLFGLLTMLNPYEYRFIFGGASCMQMLGEYTLASMYFQLAAGLEEENPAPMLHTAECLLILKDRDGAKAALEFAVERARGKEEYAQLLQKAEVMLENLTG